MLNYKKIIFTVFILLTAPNITRAAVLYMEPADGAYGPGDSFAVDIKMDINTGCINTVEASIRFPGNNVYLEDFLTGQSIISVWVDKPAKSDMAGINDKGELHFSGGIPGGYCGKIPGDPGDSNILGQLLFRIPKFSVSDTVTGNAEIYFTDPTRAMLNDGLGTEDILIKKNTTIELLDKQTGTAIDWEKEIKQDTIPPEPFVIELHQRDDIFEGRYFIIFFTTDKQTGVDHYEVLEISPDEEVGIEPELSWWDRFMGREKSVPNWQTAKTPYVLTDQTLSSIIKVKAVDKAGNERIVEYIPPVAETEAARPFMTVQTIILLAIAFLAFLAVIILLIFITHKRRHHENL